MLPRVALGNFPTPLERATALGHRIGVDLIFKREDLSGFALGGNKVRQLEVLLSEALDAGADTLVTTAAAQSNFCRVTAGAAAKVGLRSVLLLRGHEESPPVGNLLLDRLFGAEIEFIQTSNSYDPAIAERVATIVRRLKDQGRRPHLLHVTGAAGPLAAAAYASAADELAAQWENARLTPTAMYLAAGSGLTLAGLAIRFKQIGLPLKLVGICAQISADALRPLVIQRANEAAQLLGIPCQLSSDDFELIDKHIGPGYGEPGDDALEAIRLAARCEGVVLDPTYTGKAMAGLIADIRSGRWHSKDQVVFFHSGGLPAVFVQSEAMLH
jgi:D-cysteine desulfhydrase family pyridoxal phosphate-dependent enzyme